MMASFFLFNLANLFFCAKSSWSYFISLSPFVGGKKDNIYSKSVALLFSLMTLLLLSLLYHLRLLSIPTQNNTPHNQANRCYKYVLCILLYNQDNINTHKVL